MRLNTLAGTLTESSILYTDGHTGRRTDRLIPVHPRKHSFYETIMIDSVSKKDRGKWH